MHTQQASSTGSAPPVVESSALAAVLLACSGTAWLVIARLTTADMRVGLLTSPLASVTSSADQMTATATGMPQFGTFVGMWTVMMAAMMLPSLWPAARAVVARRHAAKRPFAVTVQFIAGYLLMWSAVGPAAYVTVVVLQSLLPAGSVASLRGGAALLLIAGAYQLMPYKQACLRKCHSAGVRIASQERMPRAGRLAALAGGLVQGAYCLGSSWPLMLVVLLVGMMNLAWMGAIALLILFEKALPRGQAISKTVGIVLIATGMIVIAAPHALPALVNLASPSHLQLVLH